jgi:dipeptidyl aminopeptidase/acylaminoacyl peptidase
MLNAGSMRASVKSFVLFAATAFSVSACGPEPSPEPAPSKAASVLRTMHAEDAGPAADAAPPPPPARVAMKDDTLPPRKVFFSNPDHRAPRVSPDGKSLAWIADADGVANVYIAPISDITKARVVTHDKKRGVRSYWFSTSSAFVLYPQDDGGDENFHIHSVDLKTNDDVDLTPIAGARAELQGLSPKKPNEIVVGLNDRDKRYFDFYSVDLKTKKRTLLAQSEGFSRMHVDDDFRVRIAVKPAGDGSQDVLLRSADGKSWLPFSKVSFEDAKTTRLLGFDRDGKKAYVADSRGRNTAALVEVPLDQKASVKVLLDDGQADISDVMFHPTDRHLQAAFATYERLRTHVIDPKLEADFDDLKKLGDGDVQIASRSLDDNFWVVNYVTSDAAVSYYVRDRKKKTNTFLFKSSSALDQLKLSPMKPVKLRSRDGLELVSYLTLPRGAGTAPADATAAPAQPLPMVLLVHGGPWGRDTWGLDAQHQWLASRGYAVLSVNYRGSSGFGKDFIAKGDHEWAAKMHDDLIDAVNWAVTSKIADKDRIAIMGGSYGGYATLVGLTFTPDTFACGVDIVGPSNLVTLLQSIPPYWAAELDELTRRVGDYRTEEGKKLLLERSPLLRVESIKKPLLIGQGKNDPRVKQAESDRVVEAMNAHHIPVTYVLYPDEGHGFARPQNKLSFYAVAEPFIAQCLGGPYQPVGGDFAGSSIAIPTGKDAIAGIAAALP